MSERVLVRVTGTVTALLLALLLARMLDIARAMETVADYVSPLVMAHDAHLYPGSRIVLGNYGWYNGFWAARLVGWLPRGDQLSSVLPMLITIAVFGALAAQARRLWNTTAALALVAFGLAAGGQVWIAAVSWSVHYPTWWAMAAAGVTCVAAAGGRRRSTIAGATVTVLWGGLALAGDTYGYAVIVVPLAAAVLAALALRERNLAGKGVALIVLTVGSALLWQPIVASSHLVKHVFPVDTVSFEALGNYAALAFTGITQVWAPFGTPATWLSAAAYLGALLLLGAAGAVPALLRRCDRDVGRVVWTAFWAAAALGCVAAFMLNTTSNSNGTPVLRYLYVLTIAGPALLAAVAGSGLAPRLALGAVALLAVGAGYGLVAHSPQRSPFAHGPAQDNIRKAVRTFGLTRGYASYQTAYAMERALRFEVPLLPVQGCANMQKVCPFYLHRIDGAYTPQPGTRTFLLVDHSPLSAGGGLEWLRAEPAGSDPIRSVDVGDGLTMKIYDHDVADLFGPAPALDAA